MHRGEIYPHRNFESEHPALQECCNSKEQLMFLACLTLFQPCYQYCLMLVLLLLWYLYVCLQSCNTVAWFYLFLHTVLRHFYQHMSLYISFTSLNYTSLLPNASIVNAQFIFQFSSKSVTYRNLMRPLRS